jgi:hypothetical protein
MLNVVVYIVTMDSEQLIKYPFPGPNYYSLLNSLMEASTKKHANDHNLTQNMSSHK